MPQNQCQRTCRDLRPLDPDTWCSGCREAEAEDREENFRRWHKIPPDCMICGGKGVIVANCVGVVCSKCHGAGALVSANVR